MQSHWTYRGTPFTEIPAGAFGFIYRIINLTTGRFYIGRKQFISVTRKKVAGRKNRKVVRKETKWREYTGSNNELNKDVEFFGKENFSYEVLAIGYTKGQCNYLEENVQHRLNVVIDGNTYNDSVGSGKWMNMIVDENLKDALKNIEL